MTASCLATGLFILSITAEFIYAKSTTELSAAMPVSFVNGAVRIPVASVNDGNLHRFAIDEAGRARSLHRDPAPRSIPGRRLSTPARSAAIRATTRKAPTSSARTALPPFSFPSIGSHGGCNPIPIASKVDGDQLVIAADKLIPAEKLFRNPS